MPTPSGIFVLGALAGGAADEIHAITERFDPRLARMSRRPHVTLAGSSGVGPIPADTPVALLREHLAPVAAASAPITLQLGAPERFPGTSVVVLPIAPHGPIRMLHDRIATSGLRFTHPRFAFSPHVTLTLYRTLAPDALAALLAVRIREPVLLDRLDVYFTRAPSVSRRLLSLPLAGPAGAAPADGVVA